jgi:hypothetical protein
MVVVGSGGVAVLTGVTEGTTLSDGGGVMVIGPPMSGIVGVSSLHADNNEDDNRVKLASINLILILMIFPSD